MGKNAKSRSRGYDLRGRGLAPLCIPIDAKSRPVITADGHREPPMIHRLRAKNGGEKLHNDGRSANFDLINRATNATLDRPLHETYFGTVNFRAHFKSDYDVFITPVDCNVSLPIFEKYKSSL